MQLTLFNTLGQLMETHPLGTQDSGEYQTQLDTEQLPVGVYWLMLETQQGKLIQKIIK